LLPLQMVAPSRTFSGLVGPWAPFTGGIWFSGCTSTAEAACSPVCSSKLTSYACIGGNLTCDNPCWNPRCKFLCPATTFLPPAFWGRNKSQPQSGWEGRLLTFTTHHIPLYHTFNRQKSSTCSSIMCIWVYCGDVEGTAFDCMAGRAADVSCQ
jgi:hypothetical protein